MGLWRIYLFFFYIFQYFPYFYSRHCIFHIFSLGRGKNSVLPFKMMGVLILLVCISSETEPRLEVPIFIQKPNKVVN